jgi:hypothetical protein
MKNLFFVFCVAMLMIGYSVESNATDIWKVKVTQRGGKNTPCGVRFNYVKHYTGSYTENITCTGRGNLECPPADHVGGQAGIISIIESVTNGTSEGTMIDYQYLTLSSFSDGSYSEEDEAASFDATILIFESLEELENYLSN